MVHFGKRYIQIGKKKIDNANSDRRTDSNFSHKNVKAEVRYRRLKSYMECLN